MMGSYSDDDGPCKVCGGSGVIVRAGAPNVKCYVCDQKKFEEMVRLCILSVAATIPAAFLGDFILNYPAMFHIILQEVPWDWLKTVLKPIIIIGVVAGTIFYYWLFVKFYKITPLLAVLFGVGFYVSMTQHDLIRENREITISNNFSAATTETHTSAKHKKLLGLWQDKYGFIMTFLNTGNLIRIAPGEQVSFDAVKWELLDDDGITLGKYNSKYSVSDAKLVIDKHADGKLVYSTEYNRPNKNNQTLSYTKLLYAASMLGSLPVVKSAYEHGAYVDYPLGSQKETALIAASKLGHKDIVLYLLNKEVYFLYKDNDGRMAYDYTVMKKHNEIKLIFEEWYRRLQANNGVNDLTKTFVKKLTNKENCKINGEITAKQEGSLNIFTVPCEDEIILVNCGIELANCWLRARSARK